jgi:endonuclease/exonuclease/phosphatase family metal-dependent hydrolase
MKTTVGRPSVGAPPFPTSGGPPGDAPAKTMQTLLLLLLLGLPVLSAHPQSHLLEIGQAAKTLRPAPSPTEIKVVSYNIRWRSGAELQSLAQLFKNDPEIGGASIIGLQEVDRHKARSKKTNTAKLLTEELGMHYAWAAPPATKPGEEEETGVVILSSYPLADVQRIVLPHAGPGKRRRVALGATIKVGVTSLRVYSVHSETRISVEKKLGQMKAVLDDLAGHPKDMPAVVLGDLNTWEPNAGDKASKLFTSANFHTPFDGLPTFSRRVLFVPIELRLDWIWLRNLIEIKHGVDRKIRLSDHWPLWLVLAIKAGGSG